MRYRVMIGKKAKRIALRRVVLKMTIVTEGKKEPQRLSSHSDERLCLVCDVRSPDDLR